jgi:hypothetical protein
MELLGSRLPINTRSPVGMGLAQPLHVTEIFASSRGSWAMLLTMPGGKACMIATGDNWEMVTRIKGDPI